MCIHKEGENIMWFLKQRKKEIEKDIAKLEQKLEKINAKIARKEEKRLGKKADELETKEENIPFAPQSTVETKAEEPIKTETATINKPKAKVGRPKKVAASAEKKEPEKKVAKRGRPKKVVEEKKIEEKPVTKKPAAKKSTTKKTEPKSTTKNVAKEQTAVRYNVGFDEENKKWTIKKSGAKRVIASYKTKEEALERAKDLAKTNGAILSVQRKNGQFGKKY